MTQPAAGRSSLLTNSLALIAGTVASQAILFLFSPVLSRVFSTTDFGNLANYNAWVAMLALMSSLRYEHAVIVAPPGEDTHRVVALTIALTLGTCAMYGLGGSALHFFYTGAGYLAELRAIALFIAPGVFTVCVSSLLIQLNIKTGHFRRLALVAAIQVVLTVAPQIALGAAGVKNGLILGTIVGYAGSGLVFAWWYLKNHDLNDLRREMSLRQLQATARKYVNFPRYAMAADAVSIAVQQFVPVFIIALFNPALAGLYSFSTRIVRAPALIVSAAVTSALRKEAMDHVNSGRSLTALFSGTVRTLFFLGLVPFVVVLLYGRQLFSWLFGEQWTDAGTIVRILSPGILLEFVALPMSVFFLVTHSQRFTFRIQLAGFVLLVLGLMIGRYYLNDFVATCFLVSAVMVVVNSCHVVVAARVAGGRLTRTVAAGNAP